MSTVEGRVVVVRDDEPGVERRADAVSGEVPDDAVAEATCVALDDAADHADRTAGCHRLDRPKGGLLGPFHQQAHLFVHVADQERGVGVAVHAADERGDVDVADVAVLQHGRVGDAVADHLVERGAQGLGEAAVAQRGRVGAVVAQVLVPDAIELIGSDAGLDRAPDLGEGVGGDAAGHAHGCDRRVILALGSFVGRRSRLAHVLGPCDRRRDDPLRPDDARNECGARHRWHARSLGRTRCRYVVA